MPIKDHPNVPAAPKDEQIIWRFMSLEKLLSLLVSGSLYLVQVDRLRKDDPFESQFTQAHIDLFNFIQLNPKIAQELFREQYKEQIEANADFLKGLIAAHTPESLENMASYSAKWSYANCWHINDHESAALWRLYSSNDAGVAIRTTVGRLKSALQAEERDLYIGEVQYIDFNKEIIPADNALNPIFRKRMSFAHERELRLATLEFGLPQTVGGISISCELNTLIEEIIVSPLAESWFLDTIRQVIAKLTPALRIRRSSLFTAPIYARSAAPCPPYGT